MPIAHPQLLAAIFVVALGASACGEGPDNGAPIDSEGAVVTTTAAAVITDDPPAPVETEPPVAVVSLWPSDPTLLSGDDPAGWTVEVVRAVPHDPGAFTQGLELIDGTLFESTGVYGESSLRRVDLASGDVLSSIQLDEHFFAEGITRVGDTLVQLTWREETALRWQLPDLTPLEPFAYRGEGWGICTLDDVVLTSDGSADLGHRDPDDFTLIKSVQVTFWGQEVDNLNELECVDGLVFANIIGSDFLVVIDPATGTIVATIDASPVNAAVERPDSNRAVLNGIADLGDGTLLLGGKLWPSHLVVRLVAR